MDDLFDCMEAAPQPAASPDRPPVENKPLPAATERHSRKCQICRHPERVAIEQEYRDWFRPSQIARHYNIADRALYRHFHAIGLASARRENLRMILDRIIERGPELPISGDTIIRAVRAQCCLTGQGWVEPPKYVIYTRDLDNGEEAANSNRQCSD